MRKALKALYRQVGQDGYGPRQTNPIYEITAKDGRIFKVSRHKWVAPTTHWAWCAEPKDDMPVYRNGEERTAFYQDTLTDLAVALGYEEVDE